MSVEALDLAEPFFTVKWLRDESAHAVGARSILVNVSDRPIAIENQSLGFFQSMIVTNTDLKGVDGAVLVERFADHPDEAALLEKISQVWRLAYDVRREERLKGRSFWMSPKADFGELKFSMYLAGSVPLNVGLHRTHVGFDHLKEVHTQIVGYGKMQQCREKDLGTLYLEEPLAPGASHRPMYDRHGNYPWHQYETITPGIFMAIELDTGARGDAHV